MKQAVPSSTITCGPFTLNMMLEASGIDTKDVLVFRHRPGEPALNRIFDRIVSDRPDLFDCYQSAHGARTEAALSWARYLASFIRYRPGTALFVGLYTVAFESVPVEQCLARPLHRELMSLGMSGFKATENREHVLQFNLEQIDWYSDWRGRLIIRWPGLERSWYRWADRNVFPVEAIAEENVLIQAVPPWESIVLDWRELAVLPRTWRDALSHWRGIYLIIDRSDGKQYVGSAYGSENLLRRWLGYARTGHGGNKLLRSRDPTNFRFSILQRVSPDLDDASVVATENSWKERLATRRPQGLNEN
jgi:hypothetical protein